MAAPAFNFNPIRRASAATPWSEANGILRHQASRMAGKPPDLRRCNAAN